MTEVRRISYDIAASDINFSAMLDEYAAESVHFGMPKPECQAEVYRAMEESGLIHVLGSFKDGRLTGFVVLMVSVLPHYGVTVATTESFFVTPSYRKSGAGLMLLREAERLAKSLGAVAMLVTAPANGKLDGVLQKTEYVLSSKVFIRGLQ